MFAGHKAFKWATVFILAVFISACAGMTAKQKFLTAYGSHVRMMKNYNDQYDLQSPEVKADWHKSIDPVLKQVDDAMAAWDAAQTSGIDAETKGDFYRAIYDNLWDLFVKYGVEIKEE